MNKGKVILNIDQSPIGDSNLYDKAWMPKNMKYSKNNQTIWPRITMIAAIDS